MTDSYGLPKVNANIKVQSLGLDFNQEISTEKSLPEEASIERLKQLYLEEPDNLVYLNDLRLKMRSQKKLDAYINFLQSSKIKNEETYLQISLAYIDKLQDPSLGTARLGQISVLSITELNKVLEMNENNWLAHYARGLNNLYWPTGLRRIDKSIQDLAYCVSVAKEYEEVPNSMWASAYTAYGDALVKKGDTNLGFKVWKDGMNKYPENIELKQRVNSGKDKAYEIVKSTRGIDSFQRPEEEMTDLSILWE